MKYLKIALIIISVLLIWLSLYNYIENRVLTFISYGILAYIIIGLQLDSNKKNKE